MKKKKIERVGELLESSSGSKGKIKEERMKEEELLESGGVEVKKKKKERMWTK